jgi:large subunit ribosomal protein L7/L12
MPMQELAVPKRSMSVVLAEIPSGKEYAAEQVINEHGAAWSGNIPEIILRNVSKGRASKLVEQLKRIEVVAESWPDSTESDVAVLEPIRQSDLIRVGGQSLNAWVLLASAGTVKVQVIKELRSVTSLGLKEAKDLVDSAPSLLGPFSVDDAAQARRLLVLAGATCEVFESDDDSLYDVILLEPPIGDRTTWPNWLAEKCSGLESATPNTKNSSRAMVVVASQLSPYLAENAIRQIEEKGGRAARVWSTVLGKEH